MSWTDGNGSEMMKAQKLVKPVSHISGAELLMVVTVLTPGSTPLPRRLTIDPPLLGHRYLPVAIAGDGAFSQTILARDVLDPRQLVVAIKAMKPGFEKIGLQVILNSPLWLMEGI
jgi:hypothetical protein